MTLALGCGAERSYVPAPEDVDYVGAILISSTGAEQGSELRRALGSVELEVPSGYSAFLFGYGAGALEPALGRSPTEAVLEGKLRAGRGCEPRLPVQTWLERVNLPEGPELDDVESPRPTAPWLSARCPDVSTRAPTASPGPVLRAGAEASCSAIRCGVEATGCGLDWSWGRCLVGAPSSAGTIDYAGSVCGQPPGCTRTEAREGADQSFSCVLASMSTTCGVDLYGPPLPLPATIEIVELYPGRESIGPPDRLGRTTLGRGLSWSVAALEDTLVVSGPGPEGQHQPAANCLAHEPSRLSVVERSSLAVVRTATAPPCLLDLAVDPGRQTFVAGYGVWPEIYLARFDDHGRELHRRRLDALPGLDPEIAYRPFELEVTPGGSIVLLLRDQTNEVGGETQRREILALMSSDLDLVATSNILDTELRHLSVVGDDRAVIADVRDHSLRWLSLPSFELAGRGGISNINAAAEPLHLAATSREDAVLGLGGAYGRFGRVNPTLVGEATLRPWPWAEAEPTASTRWPLDPSLRLVALRPGRWDGGPTLTLSALALYAIAETRYVPVASLVGELGAASQAITTPEGDIFVLYPWVGRLARVRPVP